MKKRVLCIAVLTVLVMLSLFALTACNKPEAPEGTLWSSEGTIFVTSSLTLFMVADGTWTADIGGTAAGNENNNNTTWAYGDYYFAVENDVYVLYMKIDPDKGDPANVRLVDGEENNVDNGEFVAYMPDGDGTYYPAIIVINDSIPSSVSKKICTAHFEITPDQATVDEIIAAY